MASLVQHCVVTNQSMEENGSNHLHVLAGGGMGFTDQEPPTGDKSRYTYEIIQESADFILDRTKYRPKIGIICGSGLGGLAEQLSDKDLFPYESVPHFPISTVVGHTGRLVVGLLSGVPVICMQGRFHSYEGYSLNKCAMPVRVMKLMGVSSLIVTNAAGGLNPDYKVGDIMFLKDHVNMQGLAGESPLKGKNDDKFGPRFPAMNNSYDKNVRQTAHRIAEEIKLGSFVREGVYAMLGGPMYETVAELRLLRLLGVDAVGMSTVPEVIVARHCGMKVFAFSLITNKCIMDYDSEEQTNHEEVIDTANKRQKDLQILVKTLISRINEQT